MLWFQTKIFTGLLELIQLYKQDPLEKIFIFNIYQNYTLALIMMCHYYEGLLKTSIWVLVLVEVHVCMLMSNSK